MVASRLDHIGGVPLDRIKEILPREGVLTAWLSGSLIEGLGNPTSDIDVFLMTDRVRDEWPRVLQGQGYAVFASVVGERRVDVEYWELATIRDAAEKLNGIDLDDESRSLLNALADIEIDLVHRVSIGVPFIEVEAFNQVKRLFDFGKYRQFLVERKKMYVDDAFDDAIGMLRGGDGLSAAARARYTVEQSVDVLLYGYGITTDKAKYRIRNLLNLCEGCSELSRFSDMFLWYERVLPDSAEAMREYVLQGLRLSSDIIEHVRKRMADTEGSSHAG